MAQASRTLTPFVSARHFLGAELRWWRLHRGMSLAELGQAVYVSADMLAKIEKADRVATKNVIGACDTVLDTGGALARLLTFAANVPPPAPAAPMGPAPTVLIRITTEVIPGGAEEPTVYPATGHGDARVYSLSAARRRQR